MNVGFNADYVGNNSVPALFVLNGIPCTWGGGGGITPTPAATATSTATASSQVPTSTPTATPTVTPTRVPSGDAACVVNFVYTHDWGSGFVADVTLTNTSGAALNGWTLAWTFPGNQHVSNIWNGVHTQSGQAVTVTNASWNGSVPDGTSVIFGFTGTYSGPNGKPTTFTLNGKPCDQPVSTGTVATPIP